MAEEEKPEAAAPAAAPAKAASAWPPVLAMLILMPAISFGMTQYVLIPRIKSAVMQPGAHAEAAPAAEHAAKGKEKEKKGEGKSGSTYEFSNIVVNLAGAGGTRYLKASFTAVSSKPDLSKIMTENKTQLLDVALNVLGSKSLQDLEAAGSKNLVRNDLLESFNQALKEDVIEQLYFSEFVVQ